MEISMANPDVFSLMKKYSATSFLIAKRQGWNQSGGGKLKLSEELLKNPAGTKAQYRRWNKNRGGTKVGETIPDFSPL